MAENKPYSPEEWEEMKRMREQGASYKEIAQMFGRTSNSVYMKFRDDKAKKSAAYIKAMTSPPQSEPPKTERKVTLEDFTPREIIKYLNDLGYRIEDNQIVVYEKKVINIKSVLTEQ